MAGLDQIAVSTSMTVLVLPASMAQLVLIELAAFTVNVPMEKLVSLVEFLLFYFSNVRTKKLINRKAFMVAICCKVSRKLIEVVTNHVVIKALISLFNEYQLLNK